MERVKGITEDKLTEMVYDKLAYISTREFFMVAGDIIGEDRLNEILDHKIRSASLEEFVKIANRILSTNYRIDDIICRYR